MELKEVHSILNNNDKFDVYHDDRLIWIQEVNDINKIVKVGFIDTFEEKELPVDSIYIK